jgi:DNA mismatch endonuclease, patch repair protein
MDVLSKASRSVLMGKVRSTGNRSTELRVRMGLVRLGVRGWQLHFDRVHGTPDFWFERQRLAIFVDGCFWHGCPNCLRLPKQNRTYWFAKIKGNIARARKIDAALRAEGNHVFRIWEHDLKSRAGVQRVMRQIEQTLNRCMPA